MSDTINPMDAMSASPDPDMMTVSPADTSFDSPEPEGVDDDKRPSKKRKSWGQELPVPKTNLPPRYVLARHRPHKEPLLTYLS